MGSTTFAKLQNKVDIRPFTWLGQDQGVMLDQAIVMCHSYSLRYNYNIYTICKPGNFSFLSYIIHSVKFYSISGQDAHAGLNHSTGK